MSNNDHRRQIRLARMLQYLDMNRKETFFTATVLPGIVCGDSSRQNLSAFFELFGCGKVGSNIDADKCNILFFTEYSGKWILSESAEDDTESRGIPDLVILVERNDNPLDLLLLIIEAKMFDTCRPDKLLRQMDAQKHIETKLKARWPSADIHLYHLALIPQKRLDRWSHSQASDFRKSYQIVTWEDILNKFKNDPLMYSDGVSYWVAFLEYALINFDTLKVTSRIADDMVIGAKIVERFGS